MSAVLVGCFCGWRSQRKPNLFGQFGNCKRCGDTVQSMADINAYNEEFMGKRKQSVKQMCVEHGVEYSLVAYRYYKLGWDLQDALTAPKYERKGYLSRSKLYEYKGETAHLAFFAKKYNVTHSTLNGRLKKGWNIANAIETPVRIRKRENHL